MCIQFLSHRHTQLPLPLSLDPHIPFLPHVSPFLILRGARLVLPACAWVCSHPLEHGQPASSHTPGNKLPIILQLRVEPHDSLSHLRWNVDCLHLVQVTHSCFEFSNTYHPGISCPEETFRSMPPPHPPALTVFPLCLLPDPCRGDKAKCDTDDPFRTQQSLLLS